MSRVSDQEANCLQDTLRLLTLWFDHCTSNEIYETLKNGIKQMPIEIWLQVIPQLIARIDTNKPYVPNLIRDLLIDLGKIHPQALVYRLILACNTSSNGSSTARQVGPNQPVRNSAASEILQILRESNNTLVEQAKLVSEELIRVAILWHEMWHESLEVSTDCSVFQVVL